MILMSRLSTTSPQVLLFVVLLVLALLLYTASPRRLLGPIISLALAVLVKPVALPIGADHPKFDGWLPTT